MMKDLVTPVAVDEIRNVVRKCLENAALINYTKVNEMAKNEGATRPFKAYSFHPTQRTQQTQRTRS